MLRFEGVIVKIISKKPLTFSYVKSHLKDVDEGNYEVKNVVEYMKKFAKHKKKEDEEFIKKINEIAELPEEIVVKIVNVSPKHASTVKAIALKDKIVLKDEDAEKIAKLFK